MSSDPLRSTRTGLGESYWSTLTMAGELPCIKMIFCV